MLNSLRRIGLNFIFIEINYIFTKGQFFQTNHMYLKNAFKLNFIFTLVNIFVAKMVEY